MSDGLVSLAESRELFAAHLKEVHPEKEPRDIRSIREECDRRRQEEEARKAKEQQAAKRRARAASASKSGKTVPGSKRNRKKIRQPSLTDEMINEAVRMYMDKKSVLAIAELRYVAWGFSSSWMLRRVLYGPLRDHKMVVRRGNHPRVTREQIETARRLHEEGLSTIRIAEQFYKEWGYSLRGLRHKLDQVFKDPETHLDPKPRYMTPERVEVAWHLYSQGNFTPKEIGEISRDSWGFAANTISEAIRRAGYELRANRWDNDGTRPISEEEAIRMIKTVA